MSGTPEKNVKVELLSAFLHTDTHLHRNSWHGFPLQLKASVLFLFLETLVGGLWSSKPLSTASSHRRITDS